MNFLDRRTSTVWKTVERCGPSLSIVILCWSITVLATTGKTSASEDARTPSPIVVQGPLNTQDDWKTVTQAGPRNITIEGDSFMLDGKPLHILSGSLHYFRLPSEYWTDRLRKLKAAGLNAVATYVEWSFHEPEERQYSFAGHRDVARFVRLAQEEGLLVLLRPGPYICAERDLGGLPYWLLSKYPNIKLRSTNKDFIRETKTWMGKLFDQVTHLLYGNGGPIILVQVENEYGSYGSDRAYKEQVRDIMLEHVGSKALLYTTDGPSKDMVEGGAVAGALTTIDFGAGTDISKVFKPLRQVMPRGPLMNSEFYPGWLTHWGEPMQRVDARDVVRALREMLRQRININFYVFFGGTNFEFTAGANYFKTYLPDITSYDYDAPLTESGDPTPKYDAIREVLASINPTLKDIPPPQTSPKGAYGKVSLTSEINLLTDEGRSQIGKRYKDVSGAVLPTFEELRQRAGLMLYETTLNDPEGTLVVSKPRDWIYVYVDSEYKGVLTRMHKVHTMNIQCKPGATLSLLVENQGRINYGEHIHDFKGIRSVVEFNKRVLNGTWTVTGYPLETLKFTSSEDPPSLAHGHIGPVLYQGHLVLPEGKPPLDTFLDTAGWGRGYVWVNGHNLGRYWPSVGPQRTLYVPGAWLRAPPHDNLVQVLELEDAPLNPTVEFIDRPIFI